MPNTTWVIHRGDSTYPALLDQIADPPAALYGRGDRSVLGAERIVAVVGSRKASTYGLSATGDVVSALAQLGAVTVSGLAFGVDAATHTRSIACGTPTVAVLGSAVEVGQVHPAGNQSLAERIIEAGGAVVSEYPAGTTVHKSHFPARNRIIAGLSQATVVAEAGERSGSLITARLALEYNRDVLAVPGSIYAPQSIGTNGLIAAGATPLSSCQSMVNTIQYALNYNDRSNDIVGEQWSMEEQVVLTAFHEARTIEMAQHTCTLPPDQFSETVTTLLLRSALRAVGDGSYIRNTL